MHSGFGRLARAALVAGTALNLHAAAAVGQGGAHEYRQLHLGMEVRIVAHGERRQVDRAARAAFTRIADLENVFSDWRPNSEVRRLTLHDGAWTPVSRELGAVLARALEISAASGGAFDPTVGPLSALWRESRTARILPDPDVLAAARDRVGWRRMRIDTTSWRVMPTVPGMRIDLGGIAKGWIVQDAARVLADFGVTSVLIEAGGDIYAGAAPPGTAGWKVSVRTPGGDSTLVIVNAAVATSGTAPQFVEIDRRRYAHIIDPRTGLGIGELHQLTVVASDAATADALATTLLILGREEGDRLARRFGAIAVFRGM